MPEHEEEHELGPKSQTPSRPRRDTVQGSARRGWQRSPAGGSAGAGRTADAAAAAVLVAVVGWWRLDACRFGQLDRSATSAGSSRPTAARGERASTGTAGGRPSQDAAHAGLSCPSIRSSAAPATRPYRLGLVWTSVRPYPACRPAATVPRAARTARASRLQPGGRAAGGRRDQGAARAQPAAAGLQVHTADGPAE